MLLLSGIVREEGLWRGRRKHRPHPVIKILHFGNSAGNYEELHVIPASYQIEDALELSGTKVLMKAGKKMPAVKQFLKEKNCRAVMVENCGMDTEQKYFSAEEIPDQASYYSLIIVKEKRKK